MRGLLRSSCAVWLAMFSVVSCSDPSGLELDETRRTDWRLNPVLRAPL